MLDDALDCLFNLMDGDRDGFVDEEELVSGIRSMFASQDRGVSAGTGVAQHIAADQIFAIMDADQQGRLYVSDVESFVMPNLRQIVQQS